VHHDQRAKKYPQSNKSKRESTNKRSQEQIKRIVPEPELDKNRFTAGKGNNVRRKNRHGEKKRKKIF